jgi:hypothetical protein
LDTAASVLAQQQREQRRRMRVMFTLYWVVLVAGIVLYAIVGATQN